MATNFIATPSTSSASGSAWAQVDATSELDNQVGTTTTSTSNQDSATFTPGAITVDAVALNLALCSNGSGTLKVTLRDFTASSDVDSCTINVADLPYIGAGVGDEQCWCCFKFGSSHTLTAGHAYLIRVVTSSATVRFYRDSTAANWNRKLRTTTTGSLAAQSHWIVTNEFTGQGTNNSVSVTWDFTSLLSFGPSTVNSSAWMISCGGTVSAATSASTNYFMQFRGNGWIVGGGTLNIGTSGTRMPSSSSFTLKYDCNADKDSQLRLGPGGNLNVYGATKTPWTRLTADAASSATSLTVGDNTGWLNNDLLAFSPTGSSRTQYETKSLASISGSTGATLNSGLTNAHSGTSPIQAYVLNLTRNIKVLSGSTSLKGSFFWQSTGDGSGHGASNVHVEYVEIDPSTIGSNAQNHRALEFVPTEGGSCYMKALSFNPSTSGAGTSIYLMTTGGSSAQDNITIDNCVGYDWAGRMINITRGGAWSPTNVVITNNKQIKQTDGDPTFSWNQLTIAAGLIFNGNVSISHQGGGNAFSIAPAISTDRSQWLMANFDGNEAWYSDSDGFAFTWQSDGVSFECQNCKAIRNNNSGMRFQSANPARKITLKNFEAFGNTNNSGSQADICFTGNYVPWKLILDGFTGGSDSTFNSSQGILGPSADSPFRWVIEMYNSVFSKSVGIKTAYTVGNIVNFDNTFFKGLWEILAVNCYFGGTFSGATPHGFFGLYDNYQRQAGDHVDRGASYLRCQDFNQTQNDHRLFAPQGTISYDTSIFNTASPSERLTPNTASYKMRSEVAEYTVDSGSTRVISVHIRRSATGSGDSASYNGNAPRLVILRNDALGVSADTVGATSSGSAGSWELLTYTLAAPTENGIIRAYVDCDGTAGWINVDDWVP